MDTTHLVNDLVTRARKIEADGQLAADLRYAAQLLMKQPAAYKRLEELEAANVKMREALRSYYESAVKLGNSEYEKYVGLSGPTWLEDEDDRERREREMRAAQVEAEGWLRRQGLLKDLYTKTVPEV